MSELLSEAHKSVNLLNHERYAPSKLLPKLSFSIDVQDQKEVEYAYDAKFCGGSGWLCFLALHPGDTVDHISLVVWRSCHQRWQSRSEELGKLIHRI